MLALNKCMKRYLILLFLFLNNIVLSQDSKYLSLNLLDKIDIGSSFEITDNQVGDIIKKNLQSQGFNFSDTETKYFISVSFPRRNSNYPFE